MMYSEAETLRRGEVSDTLRFAFAFALLGVSFAIVAVIFGTLLAIPYTPFVVGLILAIAGLGVGVMLITGLRWSRAIRWQIVAAKYPATPALPLPAPTPAPETRLIPYSVNGERVGEFTTDLIDGFDPRDLDWFAKYLSNGGKWTEAALEHLPLPYSGARLGKAEPSTPYSRLVGRCVDRGIIGDRGGPGNKPGILLVKDEKEIARLLRTAPPA